MQPEHVDVLVVGGGPVGATLALSLRHSGLQVMVLEARVPTRSKDVRTLALSYGSRLILERLGVWKKLNPVTDITTIHVSERGAFGQTRLDAKDLNIPALGYVVDYAGLQIALHEALEKSDVHYLTGSEVTSVSTTAQFASAEFRYQDQPHLVTANLIALADGGGHLADIPQITRRVIDYNQTAVVAQVRSELPHKHVAYERFTDQGPAALLPSQDGFALVWTATPEQAAAICQLDNTAFLAKLHEHFGDRLGQFVHAGKRSSFPLTLKYSRPVTAQRLVVLGNAAQALHPVAGQGFNLGLRDAWELAELLNEHGKAETDTVLDMYRRARRFDSGGGILFTHGLVKLFSNSDPILRLGRGLALTALDCFPPVKRFLARRMIFGG